jgi:hypothetical protein
MTDALRKLREFPEELRKKAIASREEAGRIRRTVHGATNAESNCQVRAEVWDDVAVELEALLPALEAHNKITATLKPAGDLKPKPWTDEREAAHARELLKARLEDAELAEQETIAAWLRIRVASKDRVADLERQLAALPEEGKV